ncbi:MAG TPA: haloacid dehalogenase-like hydrolase [bacterium]|nr:haloacid dehalogenase-like hydrolase [bacterium]
MKIALFDFDGTISSKDSLVEFIKYAVGEKAYYVGILKLSPLLVGFILKLVKNDIAKEKLFSYYFKGWNHSSFTNVAVEYSQKQIKNIVRPKAVEKIKWHLRQGHDVVVVSASMESWLEAWCDGMKIGLIATKLEVVDGKITGNFISKNCHGAEKVERINEIYNLFEYDYVYAYGDSGGDKEMLTLADESFYKPFR